MNVVIDANILATANFKADHAGKDCVRSCIELLCKIQQNQGRVSLDAAGEIFREYASYCTHKGEPGVGDAFFKWLHDNQGYDTICEKVEILPHEERVYEAFPEDESLSTFDRSDRKYVAVAIKSVQNPAICNAVDSDWAPHLDTFKKYNINVRQICG